MILVGGEDVAPMVVWATGSWDKEGRCSVWPRVELPSNGLVKNGKDNERG